MNKKLAVAGGTIALTTLGCASAGLWLPQLGATPTGERLARMQASPNFAGGKARNLIPTAMGSVKEMAPTMLEFLRPGQRRTPEVELPVVHPDVATLRPAQDDLRVTWLGHSTLLVDIDGHLLLTDPVFADRASTISWAGPKRFHPPPLTIDQLPQVDAVLLSHDHYDHLDYPSILALAARGAHFLVPLGVGAHLEAWGVAPADITELDWWEETTIGRLRLVCTPSRHFSGRGLWDRDRTLWSSWAVIGPQHRFWFSGDTGPMPAASDIGERLGPFDLAAIEVGAYHPAWGNIHMGPDAAVDMLTQLNAQVLLPIHWGTFNLALHAWDQPIVRLQERAEAGEFTLLAPVAGQTVRPDEPMVAAFWQGRR